MTPTVNPTAILNALSAKSQAVLPIVVPESKLALARFRTVLSVGISLVSREERIPIVDLG
jgi:hypothetical protein